MIHEAAYVKDAEIGIGTKVWQFASVIRGAKVGKNCNIGSGSILDGPVLGDNVLVGHGSFIGPGVTIGSDVFIAPNVTMCNDAWPSVSKVSWHLDELLAGFVTIRIDDGASIGAAVVILPGVVIGEGAMIAGGAIVVGNVPPHCLYKRNGTFVKIDTTRAILRMKRAQS